jgi:hypothetical protein
VAADQVSALTLNRVWVWVGEWWVGVRVRVRVWMWMWMWMWMCSATSFSNHGTCERLHSLLRGWDWIGAQN